MLFTVHEIRGSGNWLIMWFEGKVTALFRDRIHLGFSFTLFSSYRSQCHCSTYKFSKPQYGVVRVVLSSVLGRTVMHIHCGKLELFSRSEHEVESRIKERKMNLEKAIRSLTYSSGICNFCNSYSMILIDTVYDVCFVTASGIKEINSRLFIKPSIYRYAKLTSISQNRIMG